MRQADAFDSTFHHRNLAKILDRALRLAEMAGQEPDCIRRTSFCTRQCCADGQRSGYGSGRAVSLGFEAMDHPLMTLWPMWAVACVLAIAGRHETIIILSGLPWWHRVLGGVAAIAFFAAHLPR